MKMIQTHLSKTKPANIARVIVMSCRKLLALTNVIPFVIATYVTHDLFRSP